MDRETSPSPPRSARHLSPRGRGRSATGSEHGPRLQKRRPGATARARQLRRDETDAEGLLWWELKNRQLNGHKFARQVPIGPFFADFVCRQKHLVIEIDGSQHAENAYDLSRTNWLNEKGYSVLRFWNGEVLNSRGMVLDMILAAIEGRLEGCDPDIGYWPARPLPIGERCRADRGGEGENQ